MNQVKELEQQILRHKALYYQGRAEISDHEYDALEKKLKELDPKNPVLDIVGSKIESEDKVKHNSKMLSLNKSYKLDELLKWKKNYDVVSTFKVDGTSGSLIYKNGTLTIGKTRGDGVHGENITKKCYWIPSVPKTIKEKDCEIRGEIYCSEENFFKLSEEMVSLGLDKPTSQRNIVAGLIGRKENTELCRYLDFYAFDIITEDKKVKTEWDKVKKLQELDFLIPRMELHKTNKSIEHEIKETENFIAEGDYLIDGVVFAINDLAKQRSLGETAHHPRYKMAFKFAGVSKKTKLEKIEWQVSRNGILTPVGHIKTIELSGANITRVTLHNYGMVKQYDLKKGDEIEIIRSGEVIPKFLSVVKPSNNTLEIPNKCPSCETKIVIDDIRLRCPNTSKCPAQVKGTILNFIQKVGIDDLSSKRLEEMIKKELVLSIPDLYKVSIEDLLSLDKTKEKLANKLYESIQSSKGSDLVTFLSALGISGGAYNKCEKVVSFGFDSISKLKKMSVDDLQKVDSFAEKSSEEFVNSLSEKWNIVDQLENLGFNFEANDTADKSLSGKKFVITGTLSRKRSDIEKDIRDLGGSVSGSVSKATDYLVSNDKTSGSSKTKKANSLNIPIISEVELDELMNS